MDRPPIPVPPVAFPVAWPPFTLGPSSVGPPPGLLDRAASNPRVATSGSRGASRKALAWGCPDGTESEAGRRPHVARAPG